MPTPIDIQLAPSTLPRSAVTVARALPARRAARIDRTLSAA